MSIRRILKISLLAGLGLGLLLLGARAFARGPMGMHRHFTAHVDEALDQAKASPEQRAAVHAAVEHVTSAFHDSGRDRRAEIEHAIALFEADRLDPAAIAGERARHEAEMRKVGDAVVQALYDAHDALTAPQRRAVADFIRSEHAQRQGRGGFRGEFARRMISNRLDEALDAVHASDAQKRNIAATADRLWALFQEVHKARAAQLDRALAVFTADTVDAKQVAALRAEHDAQMKRIGDAIVQAITDTHSTLDAGQRKALVDWARAHRPNWSHHG